MRGSITIESALIIPIYFLVIICLLQIGIMIYDGYTFSLVAQEWAERQIAAGKDWRGSLWPELERRMIFPHKPEIIEQETSKVKLKINYRQWRPIMVELQLPPNHKARLYHFLNGRQLISHIPVLDQLQNKYLEILEKVKID